MCCNDTWHDSNFTLAKEESLDPVNLSGKGAGNFADAVALAVADTVIIVLAG